MTGENDSNIKGGDTTRYMRAMKKQVIYLNRKSLNRSKNRETDNCTCQTKYLNRERQKRYTDNYYVEKYGDGTEWVDTGEYEKIVSNGFDPSDFIPRRGEIDGFENEQRNKIDNQTIDDIINKKIFISGVVTQNNELEYVVRPDAYYIQNELCNDLYVFGPNKKFIVGSKVKFNIVKFEKIGYCAENIGGI
jgi:hypothetical protein